MMAFILHGFVPSNEAPEHVRTLGDLFQYSGTMLRTCSPESRMALFGHRFYRDDLPWTGWYLSVARMDAHSEIFILLFPHGTRIYFLQVPTHRENKCAKQRDLVTRRIGRVCRCLGDKIYVDEPASSTCVVAQRAGQPFPQGVAIWNVSSGKELLHSHGGPG